LSAFPDGAAPHDVAQVWGNMVSIDWSAICCS